MTLVLEGEEKFYPLQRLWIVMHKEHVGYGMSCMCRENSKVGSSRATNRLQGQNGIFVKLIR
jgi:hypothetical protein